MSDQLLQGIQVTLDAQLRTVQHIEARLMVAFYVMLLAFVLLLVHVVRRST